MKLYCQPCQIYINFFYCERYKITISITKKKKIYYNFTPTCWTQMSRQIMNPRKALNYETHLSHQGVVDH